VILEVCVKDGPGLDLGVIQLETTMEVVLRGEVVSRRV
jgi:hypothetical protein